MRLSQRHYSAKPTALSHSLIQISNHTMYLSLKICLQTSQTELHKTEAPEVKETTAKNLIFISLKQHDSKLHPLHVPNVIKIHPIKPSSCQHHSATMSPGQFSQHKTTWSVHISDSPLPLTHKHYKLNLCLSCWSYI